jgi:hypothetical protein
MEKEGEIINYACNIERHTIYFCFIFVILMQQC